MKTTSLLFALILTCVTLAATVATATAETAPTQRDLLRGLIAGLNWSYGLPDEPIDQDYLKIVESHRSVRIEAEQAYNESDFVSLQTFRNFGEFSGFGWISGVNTSTLLHLDFLLPWGGTFNAAASLRLPGHTFDFGQQLLIGSGEETFTRVTLGSTTLTSGPHQVTVELPPNGSIDYLELTAEQQPAVGPLAGWELDKTLTTSTLAETSLTTLHLLNMLPTTEKQQQLEAEDAPGLEQLYISGQRHLGAPSGGQWVRAGMSPQEVSLPFNTPHAKVVSMTFRGLGEQRMPVAIDGRLLAELTFPPYLAEVTTKVVALAPGDHTITATIPPRAGLDFVSLNFFDSSPLALKTLAGLDTSGPKLEQQMQQMIALLAGLTASH